MRVHLLGGFLGAGKTSLARALARHLRHSGERVAVVTNDQGASLVDTRLCAGDADFVHEIGGGCFCCRYDALEAALLAAAAAGATVAIAEAVGSCTDLIATVVAPLADRHRGRLDIAPLAVVVDPWRVAEIEEGRMPDDAAWLFHKQIEESEVVLVSRADLSPPDVSSAITSLGPRAVVIAVSGRTGAGIPEWLGATPRRPASPLDIDYDRYARAEASLGWCNARVRICAGEAGGRLDAAGIIERFLNALRDAPIAHVKVTAIEPAGVSGAIVRRGGEPRIERNGASASTGDAPRVDGNGAGESRMSVRLVINARVSLAPEELAPAVREAMRFAAAGIHLEWEEFACFAPGRPVPRHRYAERCDAAADGSCCARFYDRADVRWLLGESLHPGGVPLTLRIAEKLRLDAQSCLLDVACGNAVSLRAIRERWPVRAFGLDAGEGASPGHDIEVRRGDAHEIPWAAESFDAVLCECALSTFVDAPGALAEMRRVLRTGGRVAITDMVVEGVVPVSLHEWVTAGACLARALTFDGYERALTDAGFRVLERADASDALRELIGRIKRNIVGAALAAATGNLPAGVSFNAGRARDVLRDAEHAVRDGAVRYGVFIAETAP